MEITTIKSRSEIMNGISTILIVGGGLLVLSLITGVILTHNGRPLNIFLSGIHKLIAVGSVVMLTITVVRLLKMGSAFGYLEVLAIILAGLSFLTLIATGAILTREVELPAIVLRVHQIAPALALLSSSWAIYLLLVVNR